MGDARCVPQVQTMRRAAHAAGSPALDQRRLVRKALGQGGLNMEPASAVRPDSDRALLREVLRAPGQPLEPNVRAYFEPRLGADLSQVRIHNDARAAASARSLDARAYAYGEHIVFGEAHDQSLMAHELTHVLQHRRGELHNNADAALERQADAVAERVGAGDRLAAVGGASTGRASDPRVLRKKPPRTPDNDLAVQNSTPEPSNAGLVDDIALGLALALSGALKVQVLRGRWSKIAALIQQPASGTTQDPLLQVLREPRIVTQLSALTVDERLAVAADVERKLLEHIQDQPFEVLKTEYGQLSSVVRQTFEGGFLGWVAMRAGMFSCFVDVAHVNAYYASLVPAEFPSTKVKGNGTLVHPVLKAKLDQARALITARGWMPLVEQALSTRGLWATNIRENTARPWEIGTHAFGWAVDIEPGTNPDIRPFPTIFENVIGADAGLGPDVIALRDPKITLSDAITHATALRKTSDDIRAAFATKASIVQAIAAYLRRNGAGRFEPADRTLLTVHLEGIQSAKDKPARERASSALSDWILQRQQRVRDLAAPQPVSDPDTPQTRVQSVANEDANWVTWMTVELGRSNASQTEVDARLPFIERQIDKPVTNVPADARKLGLTILYDKRSVADLKAMTPAQKFYAFEALRRNLNLHMYPLLAQKTAVIVREIYDVFLSAEQERNNPPRDHATAGGVAAHGWLSLPPQLIAALVSNEGAGLTWLGVMVSDQHGRKVGAKDSMHFELRAQDRPVLPGGKYPDLLRQKQPVPPGDFPIFEDTERKA